MITYGKLVLELLERNREHLESGKLAVPPEHLDEVFRLCRVALSIESLAHWLAADECRHALLDSFNGTFRVIARGTPGRSFLYERDGSGETIGDALAAIESNGSEP